MAQKLENPMKPLNEVISSWVEALDGDLQQMFQVQRIYPTEIYKGWLEENARRIEYAQSHPNADVWFSTGEGVKSINTRVAKAASVDDVAICLSHLDYLKYPDMGVGAWASYEDIQAQAPARYGKRYLTRWVPSMGMTHRPGIMYKARSIQRRMANYMQDFYGEEIEVRLIQATHTLDRPLVIL